MIYLKRFGWFLLIAFSIVLFSILMMLFVDLINKMLGVWGVAGLVVVIIMIFAIIDVQFDKLLKRKYNSWSKK